MGHTQIGIQEQPHNYGFNLLFQVLHITSNKIHITRQVKFSAISIKNIYWDVQRDCALYDQ